MPQTRTMRVEMVFCCVGIVLNDRGRIIEAPPMFHSWEGATWERFFTYYERRGKIKRVKELNIKF